jgi:hypothetical protein
MRILVTAALDEWGVERLSGASSGRQASHMDGRSRSSSAMEPGMQCGSGGDRLSLAVASLWGR